MRERKLCLHALFFILLVFNKRDVFSQPVDTLYLNEKWQITEKPFASYYRFGKIVIDSFWYYSGKVTDYYVNGDIRMEGRYTATGLKHGVFFFYHPGNVPLAKGNYENNREKGIWEYFYKSGKTKCVIEYEGDGKNFTVFEYYDSTGKALTRDGTGSFFMQLTVNPAVPRNFYNVEGEFKNGKRDGNWKYYGTFIPFNATEPPLLMREVYDKGEYKRTILNNGYMGTETIRTRNNNIYVKDFDEIIATEHFEKDRTIFRRTEDDQDLMDYLTNRQLPEYDVSAETFEKSIEGVLKRLNTNAIIKSFNEPNKIYNGEVEFKLSDSGDIQNVEIKGNLTDREKEQMHFFLGKFKNIKEIIVDNIGIDAYHKIYFYSLVFAEFIPKRYLYLFPESQFVFAFLPYDKLKELFKKKNKKLK